MSVTQGDLNEFRQIFREEIQKICQEEIKVNEKSSSINESLDELKEIYSDIQNGVTYLTEKFKNASAICRIK